MARALMVIDPQIDFIAGALPVRGAAVAMENLAKYVSRNQKRWTLKLVTLDWHPLGHCSFTENGGQWPEHCVAHSKGAAIWPALLHPLLDPCVFDSCGQAVALSKGCSPLREEYSIFQNDASRERIQALFATHKVDAVELCGIAGDICVLSTLADGIKIFGKEMFTVLPEYSPSLDGGEKLANFCQEAQICVKS